jgi:thiol-disulfide isomerase/thioredoxin
MGKASRTKQDPDRRARVAAQRAAARRAEQRRRLLWASGGIVAVIIVVVAFVLVKANSNGSSTAQGASNGPTGAALTSVVNQVTNVPASTLDSVGSGGLSTSQSLSTVSGSPLTSGGKPEFLYVGAEYCPYCAAERWAMVVALSRFGTFSGLSTIHSSSSDAYPNTPTWTFYGSTYTSKYLSFVSVEETTNYRQGNSTNQNTPYVTLQNPTSAEQALVVKYDSNQSIPFIDIGNKYVEVGNLPQYGPQTLTGKSWAQIAADIKSPSNPIAKGIDGSANYLTAAICKLTNNQPGSACTSAVRSLEGQL